MFEVDLRFDLAGGEGFFNEIVDFAQKVVSETARILRLEPIMDRFVITVDVERVLKKLAFSFMAKTPVRRKTEDADVVEIPYQWAIEEKELVKKPLDDVTAEQVARLFVKAIRQGLNKRAGMLEADAEDLRRRVMISLLLMEDVLC